MIVATIGLGMLFVPRNLVAMMRVQVRNSGVASSLLNAGEQVGDSIGLAVLGTVARTVVANSVRGQLTAACRPVTARAPPRVYEHALTAGFTRGFEVAAGVALLGLLVTAVFIRVRRQDTAEVRLPGAG